MKDIDIAKLILKEEDLTLVVIKNGEVIFKSKDKGIKPMYLLATEMKTEAQGGYLADKVIGKGAAMLCGHIGIKEVYTELISNGGIITLNRNNIPFTIEESCAYIKNRDKTDYCPIEKLSLKIEDPILLLDAIKRFFMAMDK